MQQTGPRGESSGSIAAAFQAPSWPADDAQFHRALPANDEPHGSTGAGWAYEVKHDGFRFICRRDGERIRLLSRGGHDWSAQLPAIAEAMRAFPVTSATLDGEVVICGADGVSDFDKMPAVFGRQGSLCAERPVYLDAPMG